MYASVNPLEERLDTFLHPFGKTKENNFFSRDDHSDDNHHSELQDSNKETFRFFCESPDDKRPLVELIKHEACVTCLCMSNKGNILISSSEDGTVIIWDIENQTPVRILTVHSSSVRSASLSHNGDYLVTCDDNHGVYLWEVEHGTRLQSFVGHESSVLCVAISPDGNAVVSGGADKTVRYWNRNSSEEVYRLTNHSGVIKCVCYSKESERIISGSEDKSVRIWEMNTGVEMHVLEAHEGGCNAACLIANEKQLITGGGDKLIKLWNVLNGEFLRVLRGHTDRIWSLCAATDGNRIISSSRDNTVRVWDAVAGKELRKLLGHEKDVLCVGISIDGTKIVNGCRNGKIRVWDSSARERNETIVDMHKEIVSLSASVDGKFLAYAAKDKCVHIWSYSSKQEIHCFEVQTDICSVAISIKGLLLAAASEDYKATVWDVEKQTILHILVGHSAKIWSLCFANDNSRLVTGSKDTTIKIWDMKGGELLMTCIGHGQDVSSVCMSHDGNVIISGSWDMKVRSWDAQTGELLKTMHGHNGHVSSVCISADGSKVVSAAGDNAIKVWNTHLGVEVLEMRGHDNRVRSVCISDDQTKIISGSWDKTVRIWDIRSGNSLRIIRHFSHKVISAVVCTNGPSVYSACTDGKITMHQYVYLSSFERWLPHQGSIISSDELLWDILVPELEKAIKVDNYQWKSLHEQVAVKELLLCDSGELLMWAVTYPSAHVLVEKLLNLVPIGVFCHQMSQKGELISLLRHAVSHHSYQSVRIILHVYLKALHDYGEGYFASFHGDRAPIGMQLLPHWNEKIDISDICIVEKVLPELFIEYFVKNLRLLRNYMLCISVRYRNLTDDEILGSSDRHIIRGYWDAALKTNGRCPHYNGQDLVNVTKQSDSSLDSGDCDGNIMTPYVVPLKGIANRSSKFLCALVNAVDKTKRHHVFENEIVRILIEFKWQRIICRWFLFDFMLVVSLPILVFVNAVLFDHFPDETWNKYRILCGIFFVLIVIISVYFLGIEFLHQKGTYCSDAWNIMRNCIDLMTIFVCAFQLEIWSTNSLHLVAKSSEIAAALMPLYSLRILYFLGGFRNTGSLLRMIVKIMTNPGVFSFICILVVTLLSFAASFMLLFVNQECNSDGFCGDDNLLATVQLYSKFRAALLSAYGLIFGNISFADFSYSKSPRLGIFLSCLALFFIVIVLMNILIALMGDIYTEVQNNATGEANYARAKLILKYEAVLPNWIKRRYESEWYPEYIQVLRKDAVGYEPITTAKHDTIEAVSDLEISTFQSGPVGDIVRELYEVRSEISKTTQSVRNELKVDIKGLNKRLDTLEQDINGKFDMILDILNSNMMRK